MITFSNWLKLYENFKSDNAVFFSLDVIDSYTRNNELRKQTVFYEKISNANFNLMYYLMSFGNKVAASSLNSPLPNLTRALIYFTSNNFLVYVWKTGIAHQDVAKGLDNVKAARKLPDIDYLNLYNVTYKISKRGKLGAHWCFPVVMMNGKLITNITPEALQALLNQKKINDVFMFTDDQVNDLIKKVKE